MKTKRIYLLISFILIAAMFLNIRLVLKDNAEFSLTFTSLQKAIADDEGYQCGLSCYGKRTIIGGGDLTSERFENGCCYYEATIWENPTTCCGDPECGK